MKEKIRSVGKGRRSVRDAASNCCVSVAIFGHHVAFTPQQHPKILPDAAMRSRLTFEFSEVTFGIQCCHTSSSCGRDRLSIIIVSDVACSKNPLHGGVRTETFCPTNIAATVGLDRTVQKCSVRRMSNGDEHATDGQIADRAIDGAFQLDSGNDFLVAISIFGWFRARSCITLDARISSRRTIK